MKMIAKKTDFLPLRRKVIIAPRVRQGRAASPYIVLDLREDPSLNNIALMTFR